MYCFKNFIKFHQKFLLATLPPEIVCVAWSPPLLKNLGTCWENFCALYVHTRNCRSRGKHQFLFLSPLVPPPFSPQACTPWASPNQGEGNFWVIPPPCYVSLNFQSFLMFLLGDGGAWKRLVLSNQHAISSVAPKVVTDCGLKTCLVIVCVINQRQQLENLDKCQ